MECDTWRQHLASMETRHAEAEKLWNQEKGHLQRQLEQKENVRDLLLEDGKTIFVGDCELLMQIMN